MREFVLLLGFWGMCASVGALELPKDRHPVLLVTREEVAALKKKIAAKAWARRAFENLLAQAKSWLGRKITLPDRGGQWWHWYSCPTCGSRLKTLSPTRHKCPTCGKVYSGEPYDSVVLSGKHSSLARGARDLGFVFQVTGERRYAAKAAEILLGYADRYLSYPRHDIRGRDRVGGGRVGPQTLDESTWLIPMVQAYDLVWETLSEEQRKAIEEKLLRPAAGLIMEHRIGIHNIQCWKNSAVGSVGFLLGDEELIEEAIYNPDRGYWRQMRDGVLPDGVWWEGAWGYHFYTLSALWSLAEAARNCGIDLHCDQLKNMFDAPLRFAMPNLHLPAFNDSSEVDLRGHASIYELAFARYHDPLYVKLIRSSDRRNDFALWFGVGELPGGEEIKWRSINYPRSGYCILARGSGDGATWLCLKYGPHGGGHGHPDKLNFVLYAKGEIIAPDPGTSRYGVPIRSGWYRTTIAHNTLTVDERSQRPAEGRCIIFGTDGEVDYVVAEAGEIYEGVRFIRTAVLIGDNTLLFIDQVRCDGERTLDLAYHNRGSWIRPAAGKAWTLPDKPGYRYLRSAIIANGDEGIELRISTGEGRKIGITLMGGERTDVITATGVGRHLEDRVPMVIFRRHTEATAYVWAISLDGEKVEIESLEVQDSNGESVPISLATAVRVKTSGGIEDVFVVNPDRIPIEVKLPDGFCRRVEEIFRRL